VPPATGPPPARTRHPARPLGSRSPPHRWSDRRRPRRRPRYGTLRGGPGLRPGSRLAPARRRSGHRRAELAGPDSSRPVLGQATLARSGCHATYDPGPLLCWLLALPVRIDPVPRGPVGCGAVERGGRSGGGPVPPGGYPPAEPPAARHPRLRHPRLPELRLRRHAVGPTGTPAPPGSSPSA